MKTLICEDELITAEYLKEICESEGYPVVGVVSTLAEAQRAIEAVRPSLILLDINLEGRSEGIVIANQLKSQFGIPFIFITAFTDIDTINRAVGTEPLAYLVKPVDQATLIANLRLAAIKLKKLKSAPAILDIVIGKEATSIDLDRLAYVEAFANYMELVYEDGKKQILRTTMTHLENELPDGFLRIHKSFLINKRHLNGINNQRVIVGNTVLPVGRAFSKNLEF